MASVGNIVEPSMVRPWANLPFELLEKIALSVTCSDYPYFTLVCKSWSRFNRIVFPVNREPLLLHCHRIHNGECRYYSPSANKSFLVDCPIDISGYHFYSARDGWLFLCNRSHCLFINAFTGIFHKFSHANRICFTHYQFSGCPPNDFKIFAFDGYFNHQMTIAIYDGELWEWERVYSNNQLFQLSPSSNPLFCDGLIYCLGVEGNLGVYDPVQTTWTILDSPVEFESSYICNSLIESGGELLSAQIRKHSKSIDIFHFDQASKVWERVQSLGDQSLFIGTRTSIMTTPIEKEMRKKLYIPRIHEDFETIVADVECNDGQYYFKSKSFLFYDHGQDQREIVKISKEPNILCYSLENSNYPEYVGSSGFLYRIWYSLAHYEC